MLRLDLTAFIEQLDIVERDKQAEKHTRRLARAELEVLRASWEAKMTSDALATMEQLVNGNGDPPVVRTRQPRRSRPSARVSEREIETLRTRLLAKRAEFTKKQERLRRLQHDSGGRPTGRRRTTSYRLHSEQHHVECSEQRFVRLSDVQLRNPVLIATPRRMRWWWWYLDRFWWDDEGLTADEVKAIVLDTDLDRKQYHDALEAARAAAFGLVRTPAPDRPLLESVRFAVWRRDGGKCVDCGTTGSLEFHHIIDPSEGGSDTASNIELHCRSCRVRRLHNAAQASVSRARLNADAVRTTESIPVAVRQEVWERDQGQCADCGSLHNVDFDHIVSVSRGGSDIASNIELRCDSCRSRRS